MTLKIIRNLVKICSLIIFIDELDRCRPLYAIECLERIKHIFGIKRLIFVLSIDKKNLAKSIQSQYGNIDTNNYLRRFIDLEFDLKNPSIDKF
jgi:predicted KAP-like P-loop ATPase